MTKRVEVIDTEEDAREIYKKFHDKPSKRRVNMDFTWPTVVQEIGEAKAQMYRSNKWKMNPKEYEDYKHVAEAFQRCYVVPGFLRDYNSNRSLPVYGPKLEVQGPMPKHFTILAPLIGIQVRLYDKGGKLPKEGNLYEVVIPSGMLGGAKHPDTGEVFLFVYTKTGGIGLMITGDELGIEKDGIVG
jgi:hypothetical protein